MSIDELSDAYHQFEERAMPKTVTVMCPIQVPDGWAPRGDTMIPPSSPDLYYLLMDGTVATGAVMKKHHFKELALPVRPIATEKTWERPEWLQDRWKWLTIAKLEAEYPYATVYTHQPLMTEHGGFAMCEGSAECTPIITTTALPHFKSLPPADRIWRIVERGEG